MKLATRPWRIFRVVFSKELSELLRDRKTLFWLFAPPFIFPAIALLAAGFIGMQTLRYMTEGFPVTIQNAEAAPDLVKALRASPALIVNTLPVNADSSQGGSLVTLVIPEGFQQAIERGKQATVDLIRRDNSFASTLGYGAVKSELEAYNSKTGDARLKTLGVDRSYLTPVLIHETQATASTTAVTAPTAQAGGGNSGLGAIFLPLAITSWVIGGGLGLIVDTTVGEKERQTIENILVTPANRIGIVLGKMTVVFIASLLVMGLWMLEGMSLSLLADVAPKIAVGGVDTSAVIGQSLGNLGWLVLILVALLLPFVVLLNSLVMAFCSFASSYRESNTFLFLLQLMLPALVLLSVFSVGPDAGVGWFAAPLLGTIIAIRDLFSQNLSAAHLTITLLSTAFYAVAALLLASYTYSRDWALTRR